VRLASVLSLALAAAGRLAAQATGVVVGTVSDTSGRPLQNARVHVVQTALSTLSDAAGRFRLAAVPPGPATVQAQLIGFYPAQSDVLVAAGDSVAVSLVLRAGAMELNPVIVSAAKRSQLLDQAMTSVSLVSREAIAMRAVNTVDEAVDKAPGVQFINGQVNIRGSSGFVEGLDTGEGGRRFEHVLGHEHHDHMVCTRCGAILEFRDDQLEALQDAAARRVGFEIERHSLRLYGRCRACAAAATRRRRS